MHTSERIEELLVYCAAKSIAQDSYGQAFRNESPRAERFTLVSSVRRSRLRVSFSGTACGSSLDKYSFYNPKQHPYFTAGRFVFFEGTYTHTFSGNSDQTPRYDYNQIMYRLDVDSPRLSGVRESR